MLLGFKARFVPFILDGSKAHTIRADRKNQPRVGEICHCYTGLRQRGPIIQKLPSGEVVRQKISRLLGRWECVKVETITIAGGWETVSGDFFGEIHIDGGRLDHDELNGLAWRDGFRGSGQDGAFAEMMEFWRGRLPFKGQIIHWKWSKAA